MIYKLTKHGVPLEAQIWWTSTGHRIRYTFGGCCMFSRCRCRDVFRSFLMMCVLYQVLYKTRRLVQTLWQILVTTQWVLQELSLNQVVVALGSLLLFLSIPVAPLSLLTVDHSVCFTLRLYCLRGLNWGSLSLSVRIRKCSSISHFRGYLFLICSIIDDKLCLTSQVT